MHEAEKIPQLDTYEMERLEELKATLRVVSNWMVLPLYFLFWICDLIYVPQFKWKFLAIRSLVIPLCIVVWNLLPKVTNIKKGQWLALTFIVGLSGAINLMIYLIDDFSSSYYAGLNLVAIGSLMFVPWSKRFFILAFLCIFLPYYVGAAIWAVHGHSLVPILVHTFFIAGTIVIAYTIRLFHETLRNKEFKSRRRLYDEIMNREKIIDHKTKEGVRLETMSRQFSPQVVQTIKSGQLQIHQDIHRSRISAIFIDIVNSTERVVRIDKDKVHKVITMFMEDTLRTLLKYDITIDKFMGDGILGFCNDPVQHADYVLRAVNAALEIKDRIAKRQDIYENYWLNELQIRIGIAEGFANVGFYGNEKYFHSYTAVGLVMNLASRVCAAAEPNQILITHDVFEQIDAEQFEWSFAGKKTLKGFEQDQIKVYSINSSKTRPTNLNDAPECPHCGALTFLDTNDSGIYVFKCRSCGKIADDSKTETRQKRVA